MDASEAVETLDDVINQIQQKAKEDAIHELKQRFRNEYEDAEAMEMEDCINWADWLDATAEQIIADMKG